MEDDMEYVPDDDDSTTDKEVWGQDMTFSLIDEYKHHLQDFLYPHGRMIREIWDMISLNMHAKGYAVSASSCDQKWRQLKKTFKYNQLNAGRKPKVKWIYYEALQDILDNEEITKRINSKQRSIKQEPNVSHHNPSGDCSNNEIKLTCNVVSNIKPNTITPNKGDKPPKWFECFLTQYQEEEERKKKLLKKMHFDLVALERQKCVLLGSLIQKIQKPAPIPKIIDAISLSQEVFEDDEKLSHTFNGL